MCRSGAGYDAATRAHAVREVVDGGRPVPEVAQEFDVGTRSLQRWVAEHRALVPPGPRAWLGALVGSRSPTHCRLTAPSRYGARSPTARPRSAPRGVLQVRASFDGRSFVRRDAAGRSVPAESFDAATTVRPRGDVFGDDTTKIGPSRLNTRDVRATPIEQHSDEWNTLNQPSRPYVCRRGPQWPDPRPRPDTSSKIRCALLGRRVSRSWPHWPEVASVRPRATCRRSIHQQPEPGSACDRNVFRA